MKPLISIFIFLAFCSCKGPDNKPAVQKVAVRDTLLVLSNDSVTLKISRLGGAFVSFTYNNQPVNPLNWKVAMADMPVNNRKGAPFQGQFLCFGRWGSPTKGEIKVGIPHN